MEQAMECTIESSTEVAAARNAWNAALERHRQGDTSGAITLYQSHLKRNPQDAEAWMNLGAALRRDARMDSALVCYQRALRLRPLDASVWSNLGNLWAELDQLEQSLRCHRRAIELQPNSLQLCRNHANALLAAGRFDSAELAFERCLELAPDHPDLLLARAIVRLHQGCYRDAWPDFEARSRVAARCYPSLSSPRWRGERIGGKRVLLLAEQGIGDTLWAARYAGMMHRRGARVSMACPRSLHPVLESLPVRMLSDDDPAIAHECHDFHAMLMSLPGIVDPLALTIPEPTAIVVPAVSREAMHRRVAPSCAVLRIGINWSGSLRHANSARRSVPLERFLPLAALPGVQLFSLQKGIPACELDRAGARALAVDLGSHIRDFGDTAAAIEQMDVVISTEGPVAHLAGCMGTPLLALVPYTPHWIFGTHGESTPWYPAMRLVRQKSPGDWDSVFAEVLRLVGKWATHRERDRRCCQRDQHI